MDTEAYILIVTKFGKTKEVANKLIDLEFVEDVRELYGQYDIIIKLRASDFKKLEDMIAENIRVIDDIERTETLVVSDVPS